MGQKAISRKRWAVRWDIELIYSLVLCIIWYASLLTTLITLEILCTPGRYYLLIEGRRHGIIRRESCRCIDLPRPLRHAQSSYNPVARTYPHSVLAFTVLWTNKLSQTALTGAGSGMGLATAQLLASRAAILSLCDNNTSSLAAAVKSLPPPGQKAHMSTVVDVRSAPDVNSWIAATVEKLGPLDGAANIAGVLGGSGFIRDATDEDWEFVMGVNAKGVFNCLRAEMNNIKEGGSIVNVGSIASLVTMRAQGAYVASKHAVSGLTRTAAREEGPRRVRVNCVAPGTCSCFCPTKSMLHEINLSNSCFFPTLGMTWSGITNAVDEQVRRKITARYQCIDRMGNAEEIGSLMAFLLGDESKFVTGACYEISGGWTA